jgi:hypothetical protein
MFKSYLVRSIETLTPEIVGTNLTILRQTIFVEKLVSKFPTFEAYESSAPCSEVPEI